MSTRKPEGGLVSANAAARVTMHPQGFAYVYDCHTCACDISHALPVNNAAEVGAGLPDHDLRARVAPQLRLAAPRHGLDGVAQLDGVGATADGV